MHIDTSVQKGRVPGVPGAYMNSDPVDPDSNSDRLKTDKSLVKIFERFLKDTATMQQTWSDLTAWLTVIDKLGLPGKFKAWIYQHAVLPRLLWPLLVYEVPMTTVEAVEKTINEFLRRRMGLPYSLSSIVWALPRAAASYQWPSGGVQNYSSQGCNDVLRLLRH